MNETQRWLESLRAKAGARTGAVLSYDERNPDDVAESIRIGSELGVPANIVGAEPKPFKRQAEQKRNSAILSNAPATAKWLSDLTNSGLGKDDVANLAGLEAFWRARQEAGAKGGEALGETAPGRAVQRGVKRIEAAGPGMLSMAQGRKAADIGRSLDRSLDSLIAEEMAKVGGDRAPASMRVMALQIAKQRFDNVAGLTEQDRVDLLRKGGENLAKARAILNDVANLEMSPAATRFRDETLANADNTFFGTLKAFGTDPTGGLAFLAETAAETLPVLAAATATTAVTRSPAAGIGVMAGGSFLSENTTSALEFLQEKGVDISTPEAAAQVLGNQDLMREARARGLTRGLVIAMFDAVSGGVAGKTLVKSPMGEAVAQGFAQMIFGGAGEGAAQLASGQEVSWQDIVVEGLAELATAPIEVGGVAGRGFLHRLRGAAKSGETAQKLEQVDAKVAESKVKARSPDKFAEFMDQTGARDEFLYVPADDLTTYFQAKDISLEEGLGDFGIDPVEFEEMRASGNDIAVPMATYAARISGTEDAAWFHENATLDPDEMSISQAQRFNEEVREVMRDAIAQVERQHEEDRLTRASDVQVYDNIFSQLREAGRTRDVADNEARVWSAFFRTMSERYGEDALDLARSMGVRIEGPQDKPFRLRTDLDIMLNTLRAGKGLEPRGRSLVEFVRDKGGVRDEGGDVADMEPPSGVIAETSAEMHERRSQPSLGGMPAEPKGMGLDEMASAAMEEGYPLPMTEGGDEANALLDALREEMGGNPVYRHGDGVDPEMERLSNELSRRAIDLSEVSNDEAAAALEQDVDGVQYDQSGNLITNSKAFRDWFGDSKVVDENGEPLVVFHGTTKAGFGVFNTEGRGKTDGTGAFFTESMRGASTYSGVMSDATVLDFDAMVADGSIEIVEDDGVWSGSFPNGEVYHADSRDDLINDMRGDFDFQIESEGERGNYAVYLSIKNPKIIDAEGQSWNSIGAQEEFFVQDNSGETVNYFTNREDAESWAEFNEEDLGPLDIVEGVDEFSGASTDDLVREARSEGYDGVIFENITDEGPHGQGYGWDNRIFIAFSPTQIKSVHNRGTFDPNDPRILFQFAGQSAKTADTNAMDRAIVALADGEDAEKVRRETGWFVGPDGALRFEISDDAASIKRGFNPFLLQPVSQFSDLAPAKESLKDVIDHPELFASYPFLEDVPVYAIRREATGQGMVAAGVDPAGRFVAVNPLFWRRRDVPDARKLGAVLHEIQHLIQIREGWTPGATAEDAASGAYKSNAGEAEARATQARAGMTADERANVPPMSSYDIATKELKFNKPKSWAVVMDADTVSKARDHLAEAEQIAAKGEVGKRVEALKNALIADREGIARAAMEDRLFDLPETINGGADALASAFIETPETFDKEFGPNLRFVVEGALRRTDPRVLFQGGDGATSGLPDQPLFTVHNLSEEKLKHALDLGGLAAPSLAVARGDIGFDNFGEISLVGAPSMANPKNKGVRAFNADIYSSRQPRARFKVKEKDAQRVFKETRAVADDLGFEGNLDIDDIQREGLSSISANVAIKAAWLRKQGEDIPVQHEEPRPAPVPVAGYEGFTSTNAQELWNDPEFIAKVQEVKDSFIAERTGKFNDEQLQNIRDRLFDEDGKVTDDIVIGAARSVAQRNQEIAEYTPSEQGPVNQYRTAIAIDEKIAGHEQEYSDWVESEFGDVVGSAYFEDERGRRLDYTMNNIVREMTRTLRNGEGWNYGAGNVRASVAPEFRTIDEMKGARGQITDSDSMAAAKDAVNSELFELADKFAPYHGSGQDFGWGDIFSEFLKDMAKGPQALAEWQSSIFSEPVPDELIAEAGAFLKELRDLPTEYFEIKMQRPVALSEFQAAVVPQNASDKTIKSLKDAGLDVVRYDSTKEGARQKAVEQIGDRVFFQPAFHGTPHSNFDKFSTSAIGSGEGAQAFGWGMYFASLKDVAETYRRALAGVGKVARVAGEDMPGRAPTPGSRSLSDREWDVVTKAMEGVDSLASTHDNRVAARDAYIAKLHGEGAEKAADSAVKDIIPGGRDNPNGAEYAAKVDAFVSAVTKNLPQLELVDPGRTFKVDVPENDELLNWDAPLSEQPEKVKNAISRIPGAPDKSVWENTTGQDLYEQIVVEEMGDAAFMSSTPNRHAARNQAKKAASLILNKAGIPGHRYLDGGSRGVGKGTYNFVVYNDDAVRILEFEQTKRGSITLPAGGLEHGQTVISLFENADLSTIIHESGHFFLEAFQTLATKNDAPQGMRDDLAAIYKFLDVEDASQIGTPQHEKWARAFESYVMEGKAPSLGLADAFGRFKAWLTRIYQTARGLNVKLTPEVREVMDRMLATDAEIAAAREFQEMQPLFTTQKAAGMSDAAWTTYQRMAQRSAEQASQRLLEKTMDAVRRKTEKWWKAERKQVRAEVEQTITSQREHRLVEMLANQKWIGSDRDVPDMQISRRGLVDMFGEGVLAELSRSRFGGKRAIYGTGENTVSPEAAAEFFGFANASEMVQILQNTGKRRDAIEQETDRIMSDRYGDPLSDGSIEEEALAAIHSEQQAKTVASEVRHLSERAGRPTRNLTAKVFRQRAKAMIGRMSVREATRPDSFLAAERRAAKRAEDAFARVGRGDAEALAIAAQHKEQQLLNHYLYMEARDLRETVKSKRDKMRAYSKKSVREKLDGGYIEQIDAILEGYDFRVRSPGQVARAENLREFVDRMEAEGRAAELAIDDRLMDEANRKHYTRLSVDELRGLFDTIENLDHMGRFKNKLRDAKEARDLDEIVSSIQGQFEANVSGEPPSRTPSTSEARRKLGRDFLNTVLTADTLLREIDGFKDLGPTWRALKQKIDEGMGRLVERRVKMAEDFDAIYDRYTGKEKRDMAKKVHNDALGVPMSRWDLISLALNTGNENNFERLTNPLVKGHFNRADIEVALSELSTKDWETVQAIWDYIGGFWPEIAAKEKRQTGVAPERVEAKMMLNVAPGFVRGGYYPIKYDARLSGLTDSFQQKELAESLIGGMFGKAQTRNGHTKERGKTSRQPIMLDLSVAHNHVEQVIYDLEIGEAVSGSWKILQDGRIRSAFVEKGKKSDYDALEIWIHDVASGERVAAGGLQSVMRHIRSGFTISRLAINISTALIQPTGLVQSAVQIGKVAVARGTIDYMSNIPRWVNEVTLVSPLMRERKKTFERDIFNVVGDLESGPTSGYKRFHKNVILPLSFWLMQQTQFYGVDMPTWVASYQKEIGASGDEAKARLFADTMVKRAQGSGLMSDRGMLERGTLNRNSRQQEFPRMLTALGSYMFAKGNVAYESAMKTDFKNPVEVMSLAADIALLFTLEAVLYSAIKGYLPDDDEDEATWLVKETVFSALSTLPVARELSGAFQGFSGGGVFGSSIEVLARPMVQAGQGEFDRALVTALTDATGVMLHLPSSQVKAAINNLFDSDMSINRDASVTGALGLGQGRGRSIADIMFSD